MLKTSVSVLAAVAAVGIGAALAQDAASPPVDANVAAARAAVKDLAENLKAKLGAALKEGGPVAGLKTCNTEAQPLTKARSAALGLDVRRTALKVRNPLNAPSDRERKVLEDFAAKIKAGADVAKLEHAETISEAGKSTFVFMKPIPMATEPCAACHGAELKPEIAAEVAKLYPKDQATGFAAGDLRGAFVVTKPLN